MRTFAVGKGLLLLTCNKDDGLEKYKNIQSGLCRKECMSMALLNIFGWNEKEKKQAGTACGTACGAGDKPEEKPAACGTACGAGDKQ